MQQENGVMGPIYSLAGIPGVPGRGRVIDQTLKACTTATLMLAPANGNRISLLIQNFISSADAVGIHLGDDAFASNYFFIYPGQSFQIDKDFPWTGAVLGICQTSTATVSVNEVSVP